MRFKKISVLVLVAFLGLSSAALASNMGFKLTYALGGTNSYQNWISLPYNYAGNTAADLFTDLGGDAFVYYVSYWDEAAGVNIFYFGYDAPPDSVNFTLDETKSYLVGVWASTNFVIVGSHNPSAVVQLSGTNSYQNWISVPYHTTASNAAALFSEIQGDLGDPGDLYYISYWDEAAGINVFYFGYVAPPDSVNFALSPGQGILVGVFNAGTWTPAHY
jgi:hypothetical protein